MSDLGSLIQITSECNYIEQQSEADSHRFVFSYTITIKNNSDRPCQLLSRLWLVQDANLKLEEVSGQGVIGQQPVIQPGGEFSYTSGAVIETEIGTMEGKYFFVTSDDETNIEFEAVIPKFVLSVPRTLH